MSKSPEEYNLTVHPFGAVSSPFCASFALEKTASMFGHKYSLLASEAVLNSFYVDDCLLSVDDETEAINLVRNLVALLDDGGFRLPKWSSNSLKLLNSIDLEEIESLQNSTGLSQKKIPNSLSKLNTILQGQPKVIFSDNGAYNELRTAGQSLSQCKINHFSLEREIEWHFGPPEASHWEGIWE